MQKKIFTGVVAISAIIYVFILYYMLFRGFGRAIPMVMLSEDMRYNYAFNLIPFKTIIEYIMDFADGSMRGNALRNLAGNLFLFFPLGYYLPFFTHKMTKFKLYIFSVAALIVAVEITQFITRTGSLDIDDFILNLTGALTGFLICKHTPVRSLFRFRAY